MAQNEHDAGTMGHGHGAHHAGRTQKPRNAHLQLGRARGHGGRPVRIENVEKVASRRGAADATGAVARRDRSHSNRRRRLPR